MPSLPPPKKGNKNKKKQTKQTNKKRKQVVEKREISALSVAEKGLKYPNNKFWSVENFS